MEALFNPLTWLSARAPNKEVNACALKAGSSTMEKRSKSLVLRLDWKKMQSARASLIIPTYKRSKELNELFRSIVVQTVRPIEIIVVDDHTPTPEIEWLCKEWEPNFSKLEMKLRYMRNPYDRSAAIARNVGAQRANGAILFFIDSDVILYPEYIEKIIEIFKTYTNAKGVQGWAVNYWDQIHGRSNYGYRILAKIFSLFSYSTDRCKLWEYPRILTNIVSCEWLMGCMAVKREIFELGFRFDENLKQYSAHEDVLFSHIVYREFSGGLYITPYAKYVHNHSQEGGKYSEVHFYNCKKYVLAKLFGKKGLILYYRQRYGHFLFRKLLKLRKYVRF